MSGDGPGDTMQDIRPPHSRDTIWVATGFAVHLVTAAGRAIVLAHLLSPQDLGRYFILRSVAGVASLVAQLGLGPVGLRRTSVTRGDRRATHRVVTRILWLTALSTIVVGGISWLALRAWGLSTRDSLSVTVIIATITWTTVLADLGRGMGRVRTIATIERIVAGSVELAVLAGALLLVGRMNLSGVLRLIVATGVVPVGLLIYELRRAGADSAMHTPPVPTERPARAASPQGVLAESWSITVNGLLWRALLEVDLWLVAGLAGTDDAALYGVAMRLAAPLQLTQSISIYLLSPRIAPLHAQGRRAELELMLKRAARWATAGTVVAFAAIILFGSRGLAFAFGNFYARAMPVLLVLGIGQVINVASGLGGTTLLMIGRSRTLLAISALSATFTALAAAALLPRMGVMGAAIAAASGMSLQNGLMIEAVRRYAGVHVHAGPRRV